MTDPKPVDHALKPATALREQEVKGEVASLFRRCAKSANPVLAFSRASSKVGYLARDGARGQLHHLESALNEQKHLLLMQRGGHTAEAHKHAADRDRNLRSFAQAVRTELTRPREPLSTPELRERIANNLEAGQWSRARSDLDDLARRPDIGRQLPGLDKCGPSWRLPPEQFGAIQDRIAQCNATALGQHPDRSEHPSAKAPERSSPPIGHRDPDAPGAQPRAVPSSPSRGDAREQLSHSAARDQPTAVEHSAARSHATAVETERPRVPVVALTASKDRGLDR